MKPLPPEWLHKTQQTPSFEFAWRATLEQFDDTIAVIRDGLGMTYRDINELAQSLVTRSPHTFIDGNEQDWLPRAIGAWLSGSTVIFYDGDAADPPQTATSLPPLPLGTHAVFFTSGTTGAPKPILRSTEFALTEAWAYAQDLGLSPGERTVCLISPWFGAMTKHVLGMLLTGVTQTFSNPSRVTDRACADAVLLYGTPSQIVNARVSEPWRMLSVTGEPLNRRLAVALADQLSESGRIHDALGSTECGVIARRWLKQPDLLGPLKPFCGDILPKKTLCTDAAGRLSVSAYGSKATPTGDVARIQDGQLTLLGRTSALRKVHGLWLDTSPLLALLHNHSDITFARLAAHANDCEQLVVELCLKSGAALSEIDTYLLRHLTNLHLFPQLHHYKQKAALGPTGKHLIGEIRVGHTQPTRPSDIVFQLLTERRSLAEYHSLWARRLFELGLDSLDITELVLMLEDDLRIPLTDQVVSSDAMAALKWRLLQPKLAPNQLRQLGASDGNVEVLCVGRSLEHLFKPLWKTLGDDLSFQYSGALRGQSRDYTLTGLANAIISENASVLGKSKLRVITGFSIDALLAVELAYQLSHQDLRVDGVFLLDPPSGQRRRWLRIRHWLLSPWLQIRRLKRGHESQRESRRNAIAHQPARQLGCKVLLVERAAKDSRWVRSRGCMERENVVCDGHDALVDSMVGQRTWTPAFESWLRRTIAESSD